MHFRATSVWQLFAQVEVPVERIVYRDQIVELPVDRSSSCAFAVLLRALCVSW